MGKWLHRGLSAGFFCAYAAIAPGGYLSCVFHSAFWWGLTVFGLLLVWFAEWLDDRYGPVSNASHAMHVRIIGWTFLAGPAVWDLTAWALFESA
jgi:hypothetical protein